MSRGLGDTVEKVIRVTGVKKAVNSLVKDCGCAKRQEKLNELFPYKKKDNEQ